MYSKVIHDILSGTTRSSKGIMKTRFKPKLPCHHVKKNKLHTLDLNLDPLHQNLLICILSYFCVVKFLCCKVRKRNRTAIEPVSIGIEPFDIYGYMLEKRQNRTARIENSRLWWENYCWKEWKESLLEFFIVWRQHSV